MDPGPLPPHERPWRHPSELGPPEHEASSSGAKVLIVTTATLSLLLVGLLVVAMTPGPSGSDADGVTTVVAVRADQASAVRFDAVPIVAPVGEHGLALTTSSAVGRSSGGDELAVQLPNGAVVDAAVVSVDEERGLAVVSIPDGVATETFAVADVEGETLAPDDTVMVHGAEPEVMSVAVLRVTEVDEGTPVSDGDGNLLGLCTVEQDATTLMAADASAMTAGSVATTAPPAPSASTTIDRGPTETVSPVATAAATTSGTD